MGERLIRAAQLFDGWHKVLIHSALEGCMGSVKVCSSSPEAALIENGDFLFLAGDAASTQCEQLLNPYRDDGRFHLLACRDEQLHRMAGAFFQGRAAAEKRWAFDMGKEAFDRKKLQEMANAVPKDVELRPFDSECFHLALQEEWSKDLCSQFATEAEYLQHGLGIAALCGDTLVGGASSYVYSHHGIEIELDTRMDQRRRGIASACAARLVLECLERNLYPGWDAANPVSARLAQKLGYRGAKVYPVWFL